MRIHNQIKFLIRSELKYREKLNELGILGVLMLKEGQNKIIIVIINLKI